MIGRQNKIYQIIEVQQQGRSKTEKSGCANALIFKRQGGSKTEKSGCANDLIFNKVEVKLKIKSLFFGTILLFFQKLGAKVSPSSYGCYGAERYDFEEVTILSNQFEDVTKSELDYVQFLRAFMNCYPKILL